MTDIKDIIACKKAIKWGIRKRRERTRRGGANKREKEAVNPFTARVFDRVLWGNSNFWVCGQKPMMSPFKWKLSACTFTWCYLFLQILENEIWKFGWNLPLATFDSERVKSHPFRGRYLGMSVDQPPKKGILNWQLVSNNFFWWFLDN